jgi:L-aspartate oxidase
MKRHHPYEYDIIVVGSGIAGLFAVLRATDYARVCLLTKGNLHDTNTWLAQGGIAVALGEDDSPEQHLEDTLTAGAGICDRDAVSVLVEEGPDRVRELLAIGTPFDQAEGRLALTREGAHHRNRVLHAGGDATGRLIQETLQQNLNRNVTIHEHTFVTELLTCEGSVCGVKTLTGESYTAGSVILATGGLGQVYLRTTNPEVATGDGVAMAYRAGATITDMEFIQFHPTVFAGGLNDEAFLISEAVRGEGAVLRNSRGERFMDDYHEMAELGPRDVVARAMVDQMKSEGSAHVFLDVTHRDEAFFKNRFPTIYSLAMAHGLNPARDWLPVVPAAHYTMGGIRTGLNGDTSIKGLFACGEAACSGVHGANRLASNSLLDGLVFAARAVEQIKKAGTSPAGRPDHCQQLPPMRSVKAEEIRQQLRLAMFNGAGILRDKAGLLNLGRFISHHEALLQEVPVDQAGWELQNLFIIASLIQRCALARTESRGAHFRADFPITDPSWARHLYCSLKNKEATCLAPVAV